MRKQQVQGVHDGEHKKKKKKKKKTANKDSKRN